MINMIKKEMMVSLRTMGMLVMLVPVIQLCATFLLGRDTLLTMKDTLVLNDVLVNTIMYFPAMQMPMVAMLLFQAVISEERKQRIIQVLFANGVSAQKIWRSKILTVISISYIVNVVGIWLGMFYVRIEYGIWLKFSIINLLYLYVLIPLISMIFVHIICLISWISKRADSFVGFLPGISYVGCMYMNMFRVKLSFEISNLAWGCIIILISFIVFIGCEWIAKSISKEHLVNIAG